MGGERLLAALGLTILIALICPSIILTHCRVNGGTKIRMGGYLNMSIIQIVNFTDPWNVKVKYDFVYRGDIADLTRSVLKPVKDKYIDKLKDNLTKAINNNPPKIFYTKSNVTRTLTLSYVQGRIVNLEGEGDLHIILEGKLTAGEEKRKEEGFVYFEGEGMLEFLREPYDLVNRTFILPRYAVAEVTPEPTYIYRVDEKVLLVWLFRRKSEEKARKTTLVVRVEKEKYEKLDRKLRDLQNKVSEIAFWSKIGIVKNVEAEEKIIRAGELSIKSYEEAMMQINEISKMIAEVNKRIVLYDIASIIGSTILLIATLILNRKEIKKLVRF
mgnify:CR=1 FL=1